MSLSLELILIGNELLSGHKKDANWYWLTTYLKSKGLKLSFVQAIGDNNEDISAAFTLAASRSNLIFCSGGLGPTLDDLTKNVLASTFNLPIKESLVAKNLVTTHYTRHQRICDFSKNGYHLLPENTEAIVNPVGFAPGIFYQASSNIVFMLAPGVPREFSAMIEESFWPKIETLFPWKTHTSLLWRTSGIAEEKIFKELAPTLWNELATLGTVSSLPHLSGVDIGLELENSKNIDNAQKIMQNSAVAPFVWTTENISLAEYLVRLAKEKNISFGFVESCTGGLASHLITQVPGCSEVFKGSLVTYQNTIKNSLLQIDAKIMNPSAVNQKTSEQMSQKGLKLLQADWCLSFTGYAGPSGGDIENPVGRAWIGLSSKENTQSKMLDTIGTRFDRIERFTYAGLHLLRIALEKI